MSKSAFIDIGSNAIRLAIYSDSSIGAMEIYSEKFKADVRSFLSYNEFYIRHPIFQIFEHISFILKQNDVKTITAVGTAALRNHPSAQKFIDSIYSRFNFQIRILSGSEEAVMGATGVISANPEAEGYVIDLGGGSLEIAQILNQNIGLHVSIPFGTKTISHENISQVLDQISLKISTFGNLPTLYLIGGSFRIIGRLYIESTNYPLKNLHNLSISKEKFLEFIDESKVHIQNTQKSMYQVRSFSIKSDLHLFTSRILKLLIENLAVENIIISNYGLKEGLRFNTLEEGERNKNIISERCKKVTGFQQLHIGYSSIISNLICDISDVNQNEMLKITEWALILNYTSSNIDFNLKPTFLKEFILSVDIPFTHSQRIIIAIMYSIIYTGRVTSQVLKIANILLNDIEIKSAKVVGLFLHIVYISYGCLPLKISDLKINKNIIEIKRTLPKNIFEKVKSIMNEIKILKSLNER